MWRLLRLAALFFVQRLFAAATVISLLLWVIVVFLRIRSCWRWDAVWVELDAGWSNEVCSEGGRFVFIRKPEDLLRRVDWLSGAGPLNYPARFAQDTARVAGFIALRESLDAPTLRMLEAIGLPASCTVISCAGFNLRWDRDGVGKTIHLNVIAPYWMILVPLTVLPTIRGVRRIRWRRRRVAGLCRQCGYNLTGNTSGVCPECGSPMPDKASVPSPRHDGDRGWGHHACSRRVSPPSG